MSDEKEGLGGALKKLGEAVADFSSLEVNTFTGNIEGLVQGQKEVTEKGKKVKKNISSFQTPTGNLMLLQILPLKQEEFKKQDRARKREAKRLAKLGLDSSSDADKSDGEIISDEPSEPKDVK